MSLYDILGVSPTASPDDIKKAYRRQAMKWHPDRNPDHRSGAEIRFKEIGHAYSVLSDPVTRKAYDEAACESEAAFQEESRDFTADDAFATFLSAILDLAFSMALHGADQITIYRALTADGCPESIAQTVAKRAHAMANRGSADPTTDSGPSARRREAPASTSSVPPPPRRPQASDEKVEIRKAGPWARFWARTLDVLVMTPAALVLLPLMIEAVAGGSSRFAFGMLALLAIAAALLLPFFLDACAVALFGNSLGKALLGIRVTRKDGSQPDFSDILKRNLYVWGYGYWTGLMPLVSWIPMLMAYRSLTGEKGETKWDAVLGYDVHRTPVGAARIFVFVLSFMVAVLVANLTELTTAQVFSRLASKVGAVGNRQSAKLLSDEEVGIKRPPPQPPPGPFDDLIPKRPPPQPRQETVVGATAASKPPAVSASVSGNRPLPESYRDQVRMIRALVASGQVRASQSAPLAFPDADAASKFLELTGTRTAPSAVKDALVDGEVWWMDDFGFHIYLLNSTRFILNGLVYALNPGHDCSTQRVGQASLYFVIEFDPPLQRADARVVDVPKQPGWSFPAGTTCGTLVGVW